MKKTKLYMFILILVFFSAALVFARAGRRISNQRNSNQRYSIRTDNNRAGAPDWETNPEFSDDVFTFVRIEYTSGYSRQGGRYSRSSSGGEWDTDHPYSDLNFSYRLQQLTSMQVDPDGVVLKLTDPELFDYPFIYIVEPGRLVFSEQEVNNLRKYLLNGGFLMIDDFWGEEEWYNIYYELKRVFPQREPVELTLEHPIFHFLFELQEIPQIPSIRVALSGVTYEREDAKTPYYMAIYDDQGRIMVIICRNTDLGDGWEREGENEYYFREFSEKIAYPLGMNIVFYAMTH